MSDQQAMPMNADLAKRIQAELGENVYLCYQCVRCTSGCPLGEFFDWQPHQVMRSVQLGQEDIALQSETPWLCAACQTCATRCPQGLNIPAIMEFLSREALEHGFEPPVKEVDAFNKAFMRQVRLWNRAYEPGMMLEMKLRGESLTQDIELYLKMLSKRKVAILPHMVRPPRKVKPVPDASHAIAYIPGCSLHSTAPEFNESSKAVCEALGIDLVEPDNWVCCGSSAAHRVGSELAVQLPLDNLSIVEQSGFQEVTLPCAACFNRHKAAVYEVRQHGTPVSGEDSYQYQDSVRVNTLIDTIVEHIDLDEIRARVERPLDGLKVVSYYGCLLTRPPEVTEADHPENPVNLDRLVSALGAEALDWSYKTACCGATHSLTRPDIVLKLSGRLLKHAREVGADVMVVACPLCHANLDARQFQMELDEPMPVLYFTQLMAVALGLPEKAACLGKNLVDPYPVLNRQLALDSR